MHPELPPKMTQLEADNDALRRENEQLKQELEAHRHASNQLDLYKTAILHIVNHELRTPMLQVKSAISLLTEDMGEENRLVELATGATTRLEARIRNIALLNDLMNESFQINAFESVLMNEVIDSAIRNLRRRWEYKDKVDRIKVHIEANLPAIWGDKPRLIIAIELVLDNALKFSEKEVTVTVSRRVSTVRLAIRDRGIGIPKQYQSRIFDPFFQVDSSATRKFAGMGLGLTIAKSILDRHNAPIQAESKVGKGTTFSFELQITNLDP